MPRLDVCVCFLWVLLLLLSSSNLLGILFQCLNDSNQGYLWARFYFIYTTKLTDWLPYSYLKKKSLEPKKNLVKLLLPLLLVLLACPGFFSDRPTESSSPLPARLRLVVIASLVISQVSLEIHSCSLRLARKDKKRRIAAAVAVVVVLVYPSLSLPSQLVSTSAGHSFEIAYTWEEKNTFQNDWTKYFTF